MKKNILPVGSLSVNNGESLSIRLPLKRIEILLDLERVDRDLLLPYSEELKVIVDTAVSSRVLIVLFHDIHFFVSLNTHTQEVTHVLPEHLALDDID